MHKLWIGLGSLAGLAAVGMAAATAHGLPDRLDAASLQSLRIAVQMQGWHALALVTCGVWATRDAPGLVNWAAAAFALGLLLFCGAVHALVLGGVRVPLLAPAGGMLLMAGWALLGLSALLAR